MRSLARTSRAVRLVIVGAMIAVLAVALTAAPAVASHWRTGVYVDIGPFWWGHHPYWAYPPYYPAPYYVYPPPPVIVEEPRVYIQQAPRTEPPPPAGPYWYYCPSARAYYPTVPACPEPWVKVPPRPE